MDLRHIHYAVQAELAEVHPSTQSASLLPGSAANSGSYILQSITRPWLAVQRCYRQALFFAAVELTASAIFTTGVTGTTPFINAAGTDCMSSSTVNIPSSLHL